jgi:hypothetical protein
MQTLTGKLRWYPGDALVEIRQDDLQKIAKLCGVRMTLEEVKGNVFVNDGKRVIEDTAKETLEEMTQTVVTITAPTEQAYRETISELIDKYRAPRTVYALWGSDDRAKQIFEEMAEVWDNWY